MIQRIPLGAIRAIVFGATFAACSPTEPSDYLDVDLSIEGDPVTPGATGALRIEVTSRGFETVLIDPTTCPPRVYVYASVLDRIEQPPVPCPLALSTLVSMAPGETYAIQQAWYAMSETLAPLPPGAYDVQAWVTLDDGDRVFTNRVPVTVQAAP